VKRTFGAAILLGLTVAFIQNSPAQGQTQASSTFQVVPTPNENFNSELFAASASSPNDIWAVGQSTIHFDGTTWTAFPAPMIKGDNNSFLQGVVAISPTLASRSISIVEAAQFTARFVIAILRSAVMKSARPHDNTLREQKTVPSGKPYLSLIKQHAVLAGTQNEFDPRKDRALDLWGRHPLLALAINRQAFLCQARCRKG